MKSLTKHLIEESIINKYDNGYSGISKVLSNHKIKSIDFVFDVSGSTSGKDYGKWTYQADMIVNQAGQWGIRERDCNYWEASDGEVRHLQLGQIPNTHGGSTTNLNTIIAEINPNPYQLIVYFTDDFERTLPNNIRGTVAIVAPDYLMDPYMMDKFERRGVYLIPDNDINPTNMTY